MGHKVLEAEKRSTSFSAASPREGNKTDNGMTNLCQFYVFGVTAIKRLVLALGFDRKKVLIG